MVEEDIDVFDLEAGVLCLDFANTADWHASENPVEKLTSYASLVAFSQQTNLLADEDARKLLAKANAQPEDAEKALLDGIALREAIFRIFSANSIVAQGQPADQRDLDLISDFWQRAVQSRRFINEAGGPRLVWDLQPGDLRCMLWQIVQSAVDILVDESSARVGMCEDERGCGFLFLDTSRNHTRRWCSMESCGNRAKALRHYNRSKR